MTIERNWTAQEKKTYLQRYRLLELRIQRKTEEVERWRERAMVMTPHFSLAPGGDGENRLQQAVGMAVDLLEEVTQELVQLAAVRAEVYSAIASLQEDTLRLLLEYRYLDGLGWPQIIQRLHYSDRHIYRLHSQALEALVVPKEDSHCQ